MSKTDGQTNGLGNGRMDENAKFPYEIVFVFFFKEIKEVHMFLPSANYCYVYTSVINLIYVYDIDKSSKKD